MKKPLSFLTLAFLSLNLYAQDKKTAEECFQNADYKCA